MYFFVDEGFVSRSIRFALEDVKTRKTAGTGERNVRG